VEKESNNITINSISFSLTDCTTSFHWETCS